MTFEVTLTTEDWTEFRRAIAGRPGSTDRQRRKAKQAKAAFVGWTVLIAIIMAVFVYVRLTGPSAPTTRDSGPGPMVIAFLPALIGMIALYAGVRVYLGPIPRRNPLLDHVLSYDVSAASVSITDGPEQTIRQWAAFDLFTETDRLLLLRIAASKNWVIFPKRATASGAELAAVRALFEAAAAPSSSGFPVVSLGQSPS